MLDECLSCLTPMLHPAKLLHSIMGWIERCFGLLTDVGEASRTLTTFSLGDVHVVGWSEVLSLRTGLNFVVVQIRSPPAL